MARPVKNNADYFSHDNNMRNDKKILAIRRKFGNEAYSLWNMLLETLCEAKDFRISYKMLDKELLAGDFMVEVEYLEEVVDYFIKLGLVICNDGELYSQKMLERFQPLVNKRKRKRDWSESSKQKSQQLDLEFEQKQFNTEIDAVVDDSKNSDELDGIGENNNKELMHDGVYIGFSNIIDSRGEVLKKGFWDQYDKKIDKKASKAIWYSLSRYDRFEIMSAIPLYKRNYSNRRYRKNPYIFLRNECWKDEGLTMAMSSVTEESSQEYKILKGEF